MSRAIGRSRIKRRIVAVSVVIATFGVVGLLAFTVRPLLSIGLAYKAKTLCSEFFVSGRHLDEILPDLAVDDLRPLRVVRAGVDTAEGVTTARFLMATRSASLNPGFGCTLSPKPPDVATGRPQELPVQLARPQFDAASMPISESLETRRALDLVLDEAFSDAGNRYSKRTRAIVVLHRGHIVAERYAPGIYAHTPLAGWSMTKSVLNALVGVAVRTGILVLDEPAALKAWGAPGDSRAPITVSDLLRMSSGLVFDEDQESASSDVLRMLYEVPDMAQFASSKPLAATPASTWKYSTGTSIILSQVLRERLGDRTYHSFPRIALFEPLGLTQATLELDAAGTFVAGSYMYATAREWARFGQLFLQDGVWQNQRILPEGWVAYTRTPAPADSQSSYGAHFWLSTPEEYRGPAAQLPSDVFHAAGHEAQFVTIVPSRDVVIVRLGKTRYPSAWEHDRFVSAVLEALR